MLAIRSHGRGSKWKKLLFLDWVDSKVKISMVERLLQERADVNARLSWNRVVTRPRTTGNYDLEGFNAMRKRLIRNGVSVYRDAEKVIFLEANNRPWR
jgi:hypothetical protein